ncbi:SOS response-associated peptidase family protein [Sphingomonas qomolangmaensis]|uniref:Abasic site processing protein n=1 Tax=Sphingomonas qomolangmaensis TaxID=2918765 RepID=A0ABY5L642_9SPHN|nr:SOS response-associated peptidase family protein [Sphingomonas qomolangmaensis]UUL82420.1 hypothetical protein NMP03_14805 [Sphingomonas qomolangmaensis]
MNSCQDDSSDAAGWPDCRRGGQGRKGGEPGFGKFAIEYRPERDGRNPGAGGDGDGKKPLHWFDVPSRPIFAFAGIRRPTDRGNAYGFLTTEPNTVVAPIHPKAMPVILHDDVYERWLTAPWEDIQKSVAPYPSQLMRVD